MLFPEKYTFKQHFISSCRELTIPLKLLPLPYIHTLCVILYHYMPLRPNPKGEFGQRTYLKLSKNIIVCVSWICLGFPNVHQIIKEMMLPRRVLVVILMVGWLIWSWKELDKHQRLLLFFFQSPFFTLNCELKSAARVYFAKPNTHRHLKNLYLACPITCTAASSRRRPRCGSRRLGAGGLCGVSGTRSASLDDL